MRLQTPIIRSKKADVACGAEWVNRLRRPRVNALTSLSRPVVQGANSRYAIHYGENSPKLALTPPVGNCSNPARLTLAFRTRTPTKA
jgi:hypothetical protein